MNRIDPEVVEYVKRKGKKNILIYRDIPSGFFSTCAGNSFFFITHVKLSDKEPNKYFILLEKTNGISVWADKALISKSGGSGYVRISLKKGLLKGLTIEFGSELIGRS